MKTIREIGKQILRELEPTIAHVSDEAAQDLVQAILQARKIFVAGAGRSGLMIKAFAMRLMHIGFDVHVIGETTTPNVTTDDLFIVASGSGATGSLVAMTQKAKGLGVRIGVLTIDHNSPIGNIADLILTIPAPSPKVRKEAGFISIQPLGSLFEQSLLLLLDAITLMLMERQNKTSDAIFTRHANLE
jgi:6-phospho-3-hexuloisomerase